jgi:hypothetical protein
MKKDYLKYDHFILTFKDNVLPIIEMKDGEIVVSRLLLELTHEQAEYVGKDENNGIEIAIPVGTFLQIKESHRFVSLCSRLCRLRTTKRTLLGYLVHPINAIDNRI